MVLCCVLRCCVVFCDVLLCCVVLCGVLMGWDGILCYVMICNVMCLDCGDVYRSATVYCICLITPFSE